MGNKDLYEDYKTKNTLEERKKMFLELQAEHKNRIPVIVEFYKKDKKYFKVSNNERFFKFLMDKYITISQFIFLLRRKIKAEEDNDIFLLCKSILLPMEITIERVYNKYKDEDGFLYLEYTFGHFSG